MDSLSQALLGATTFALVKDKEIGKKSLLIGAIAGTIPDLDVFLSPFFNDVAFLSVHRSVSHSVVLALVLSLILGAIFHRVYKKEQSQIKWMFAFFLSIMTHSILDWFTTYGTKLLSPFSSHLFSTNNIHVIEPIYTMILLIGVVVLLIKNSTSSGRKRILNLTIIISTLYMSWTFVSKGIANHHFVKALQRENIDYEKLMVTPTPLNSILWHGIAKTSEGYYLGTYSLFDHREHIVFYYEESAHELTEELREHKLVKYYLEYTQDFPLIKQDENGNVKIYAIKYGPVNYTGRPEFVYPLTFNLNTLQDSAVEIDYSGEQRGPVKNYIDLYERIKGV